VRARGRGSPFISVLMVPWMGWLGIGLALASAWHNRVESAHAHTRTGARPHVKLMWRGGSSMWRRAQWWTTLAHVHMHTRQGTRLSGWGLSARCSARASRHRGGRAAEGGWDGRDGSALAASAQPCSASSACMHGRRRCSEQLLQRTRMEATRVGCCPLAAGGGEVDGAPEPR
jgi:hypothetical protein